MGLYFLAAMLLLMAFYAFSGTGGAAAVTYSQVQDLFQGEQVKSFYVQDGTINACFMLGSLNQAHLQEMVTSAGIKWLSVNPETLKKVAAEAGIQTAIIPGSLYNGAVGRDILALADTVHMICRKDMPEESVYKITKMLCENYEYMHQIQSAWDSLKPETMPKGLVAPLHPGAERYYREAGLIK